MSLEEKCPEKEGILRKEEERKKAVEKINSIFKEYDCVLDEETCYCLDADPFDMINLKKMFKGNLCLLCGCPYYKKGLRT